MRAVAPLDRSYTLAPRRRASAISGWTSTPRARTMRRALWLPVAIRARTLSKWSLPGPVSSDASEIGGDGRWLSVMGVPVACLARRYPIVGANTLWSALTHGVEHRWVESMEKVMIGVVLGRLGGNKSTRPTEVTSNDRTAHGGSIAGTSERDDDEAFNRAWLRVLEPYADHTR